MQRNTLLTLCAITALGATTALGIVKATPVAPASATTFTWVGSNNANGADWRVRTNWDLDNSYPQSGDIAIIANVTTKNPIINQQDEAVGELDIESGGVLTITGQTLTLDGTVQHDIDGELHLTSSGSVLKVTGVVTMDITGTVFLKASNAVLDVDADVAVRGAGEIKGEADAAEVQIAAGKVLTNTTSIVGNMKIVGQTGLGDAGKLDNRGAVLANALNGILELGSNLLLADTAGSGRWEASVNGSAVLLFSNAHTCALLGDFRLGDCATIKFDVDIDTQGSLLHDATNNTGTIDVENGATFGYDCDSADPCDCTDITEDRTLGCP